MEDILVKPEFGNIINAKNRQENGIEVIYMLFESAVQIDGKYIYSISVDTVTECKTDIATAYDISRNRADAQKIYECLVDGFVTSCTLYDVLEELL